MCKNKIFDICLYSHAHKNPRIVIYRGIKAGYRPGIYFMGHFDNGFNGRRFVRGIKLVSALYRMQSGEANANS